MDELRSVTFVCVKMACSNKSTKSHASELQSIVENYGGMVVEVEIRQNYFIMIAAFGLPSMAHEDDTMRAVVTSLSIASFAKSLNVAFAVGIAGGVTFCGSVELKVTYEITVSVAQRMAVALMKRAWLNENSILCDEASRRAASRGVLFTSLGRITLKQVDSSMHVYQPHLVRDQNHGKDLREAFIVTNWHGQSESSPVKVLSITSEGTLRLYDNDMCVSMDLRLRDLDGLERQVFTKQEKEDIAISFMNTRIEAVGEYRCTLMSKEESQRFVSALLENSFNARDGTSLKKLQDGKYARQINKGLAEKGHEISSRPKMVASSPESVVSAQVEDCMRTRRLHLRSLSIEEIPKAKDLEKLGNIVHEIAQSPSPVLASSLYLTIPSKRPQSIEELKKWSTFHQREAAEHGQEEFARFSISDQNLLIQSLLSTMKELQCDELCYTASFKSGLHEVLPFSLKPSQTVLDLRKKIVSIGLENGMFSKGVRTSSFSMKLCLKGDRSASSSVWEHLLHMRKSPTLVPFSMDSLPLIHLAPLLFGIQRVAGISFAIDIVPIHLCHSRLHDVGSDIVDPLIDCVVSAKLSGFQGEKCLPFLISGEYGSGKTRSLRILGSRMGPYTTAVEAGINYGPVAISTGGRLVLQMLDAVLESSQKPTTVKNREGLIVACLKIERGFATRAKDLLSRPETSPRWLQRAVSSRNSNPQMNQWPLLSLLSLVNRAFGTQFPPTAESEMLRLRTLDKDPNNTQMKANAEAFKIEILLSISNVLCRFLPFCLIVDDANYLSRESLAFLHVICTSFQNIMVLLSSRMEEEEAKFAESDFGQFISQCIPKDRRFTLPPLGTKRINALVQECAGVSDVDQSIVQHIEEVSFGNPLTILELVHEILTHEEVVLSNGKCLLKDGASLVSSCVPPTVRRTLTCKLDAVLRRSRTAFVIMRIGAILLRICSSPSFNVTAVVEAFPYSKADLLDNIKLLEDMHLLRKVHVKEGNEGNGNGDSNVKSAVEDASDAIYSFTHSLMPTTILETMMPTEIARLEKKLP